MPFRRKPKQTKFDPEKKEFSFDGGEKKPPKPSPFAQRRPPK